VKLINRVSFLLFSVAAVKVVVHLLAEDQNLSVRFGGYVTAAVAEDLTGSSVVVPGKNTSRVRQNGALRVSKTFVLAQSGIRPFVNFVWRFPIHEWRMCQSRIFA